MTPLNVSVIAAQPGHKLIFKSERPHTFEVDGEVLAWRITTWPAAELPGGLQSQVKPLAVEGEVSAECVGIQNPDGSVVIFGGKKFVSWESFRNESGAAALSNRRR